MLKYTHLALCCGPVRLTGAGEGGEEDKVANGKIAESPAMVDRKGRTVREWKPTLYSAGRSARLR